MMSFDKFKITKVDVPEVVFGGGFKTQVPWCRYESWMELPPLKYHRSVFGDIGICSYFAIDSSGSFYIPSKCYHLFFDLPEPKKLVDTTLSLLPDFWQWGIEIRNKQDGWHQEIAELLSGWQIELSEISRATFWPDVLDQVKDKIELFRKNGEVLPVMSVRYPVDMCKVMPWINKVWEGTATHKAKVAKKEADIAKVTQGYNAELDAERESNYRKIAKLLASYKALE